MTFPYGLSVVTVTGPFSGMGGALAQGSVLFTPSSAVLDASGGVVLTSAPIVATVTGGTFSQELIATDNTGLQPPGWNYLVTVAVTGYQQQFFTYLSFGAYGSTPVPVAKLVPAEAQPTATNITQINSVQVTNQPTATGQVLKTTSLTTAAWQ